MKETKYTTFDIFSEAFHDTRKHGEKMFNLIHLYVLKKIVDKVNPDNSREDGFRFGTAYGKNLYYNVTQKLAKKSGSYVYTYKLMCINGKTKKAEKLKTMTAPDGEYLDGYLEEGYFKRTVSLSTFSKFNLKTKKSTGITAREYDYDLDPDYGEEEE